MRIISVAVLGAVLMFGSVANATDLFLRGNQAKYLYKSLTGSSVAHEGTAGHLYSKGTSIVCRYTEADMTVDGKAVPQKDPQRYVCSMVFDHNGLASPGANP